MRGHTLAAFVKLVVFAVITFMLTALLAITISNQSIGGSTTSYKAILTDVTGLLPGDDVRIAGVKIGSVKGIKIVDWQGRRDAQVTFSVDKKYPLYASDIVDVRYLNLVGQKYVEVQVAPGSATQVTAGHVFPPSNTRPALDLTVLFHGFQPLFQALDPQAVNQFAYEIIKTLQGEGGTFQQLLANTSSLTNTLAARDQAIGDLIDNLTTVLATVDERNQGLASLIDNMQRLVTGLASDRQTISASLGNINSLAVQTASLLQGIRPSLPADLVGLSGVTHTLATTKNPDGSIILEEFLKRFPTKLNTIIRTATYGSWFNFWLCDADAFFHVHGKPTLTEGFHVNSPVCGSGSGP